jgi:hypothetical protein
MASAAVATVKAKATTAISLVIVSSDVGFDAGNRGLASDGMVIRASFWPPLSA